MKFKDSIIVKKHKAKTEEVTHGRSLIKRRLIAYLIYFLLTHLLASLFFSPLLNNLLKGTVIVLTIIFYFNHLLFILTAFMNPGYVETNFVPVIDANAYVYDETKKPEEELSVIESNYKLDMKTQSKRAQTQGNISRNHKQMLIKNPGLSYTLTIANQGYYEDNHSYNDDNSNNCNGKEKDNDTNFDTVSIKKTTDRIIVSPSSVVNNDKPTDDQEHNQTIFNNNNTTSPNNPSSDYTYNIYCLECLIEIPLRAKHCPSCNKCVATFDHHCTWLSNCIGERNKAFFIVFLMFHSILLALAFVITMFHFKKETQLSKWLIRNWSLLIFDWLDVLFFSFVFSLLVFQLKILFVNQTSWENYTWHKLPYMRKLSGSQLSPFDYGFWLNVSFVLCHWRYIPKEKKRKKETNNIQTINAHNKKDYYNNVIDWNEIVRQYKRRRSE